MVETRLRPTVPIVRTYRGICLPLAASQRVIQAAVQTRNTSNLQMRQKTSETSSVMMHIKPSSLQTDIFYIFTSKVKILYQRFFIFAVQSCSKNTSCTQAHISSVTRSHMKTVFAPESVSFFPYVTFSRREALSHLRSQGEPAGHAVGHGGTRGWNFSPWPVPPSWQEEKLSDVKEHGVDLNQQRHHREAHVEAGRCSQDEAGDHLRYRDHMFTPAVESNWLHLLN